MHRGSAHVHSFCANRLSVTDALAPTYANVAQSYVFFGVLLLLGLLYRQRGRFALTRQVDAGGSGVTRDVCSSVTCALHRSVRDEENSRCRSLRLLRKKGPEVMKHKTAQGVQACN